MYGHSTTPHEHKNRFFVHFLPKHTSPPPFTAIKQEQILFKYKQGKGTIPALVLKTKLRFYKIQVRFI